jgi:hypothetical protein
MPFIVGIPVPKHLAHDGNDDRFASIDVTFCPPNEPREWPRTVGDIEDTQMKAYLKHGGVGVIGSTPLFHFPRPWPLTFVTQSSPMELYIPTIAFSGFRR